MAEARGTTTYAKVFTSLWNGSLRGERDAQLVFIYLLCHANELGVVEIIRDKIVDDTGVGRDGDDSGAIHRAIELLEAADPHSRSKDDNGRRIIPIDPARNWGWKIVNYEFYRQIRNELERREQNRLAQQRWYAKYKQQQVSADLSKPKQVPASLSKPNQSSATSAKAEEEAEVEVESFTAQAVQDSPRGTSPRVPISEADGSAGGSRLTAKQAFDSEFWPAYPRKVGRRVAERAFLKLIRDGPETDELFDELMHGLEWYIRDEWANREPDKIPHATTWLNQRRWEDAKKPTR